MTIQNFFTKIPEDWFFRFFSYIERRDAKNIASVDKVCSECLFEAVQDIFDTLYVLKTPSSSVKYQVRGDTVSLEEWYETLEKYRSQVVQNIFNALYVLEAPSCSLKYQICGDTVSLEGCYETLEKYRLRHLVMILSSHPEDTLSCIEKRTQGQPVLSMLSLKVSFTFKHSYIMCSLMEAMKESGYSFGTVTFMPTVDRIDFQDNLKMVQSNYMPLKECLKSFPEVTTKAVYDFPSYKIIADATKPAIIDCKKFLEEDPNEWTETFHTTNIPNLVVGLNTLEDIPVLQRVVPEKTSVQNLLIVLPYKVEDYDNIGNYIERRYQNLFNLIQTKFTNVTELIINLLSYNEDVLVALFGKVIHPILASFRSTKVFFFS